MWNPVRPAAVSAQVTWIAYWPVAVALTLTGRPGAAPAGPLVGRDVLAVLDGCAPPLVAEGAALLVGEDCTLLVGEDCTLLVAKGSAVGGCCVAGAVVARNACGCLAASAESPADLARATAPAAAATMSAEMSPASISRRRVRRRGGLGPVLAGWGCLEEGPEGRGCFPPVTVTGSAGPVSAARTGAAASGEC
jgi:hypothetical protein